MRFGFRGAFIRGWMPWLMAMLAVSGHEQASAAKNDLARLITNHLNGTAAECQRLKDWAQSVTASTSSGNGRQVSPNALALAVQDDVFVPHFGKPYDQLVPENFRMFQGIWRECERTFQYGLAERNLILNVWSQGTQARLSAGLTQARAAQVELDGILTALPQLQPNEQDFDQLQSMRTRGQSLVANAGDEATRVFRTRLDEAWRRVGVPMERQRTLAQIDGASGSTGLMQLASIKDDLGRRQLPDDVRAELTQRANNRIGEMLPAIVNEERRISQTFAPSYEGLVSSAEWVRDFDRRFASLAPQQPALTSLRQEVMQRRLAQLDTLKAPLELKLRTSRDIEELTRLPDALFLPEERGMPVATRLLDASEKRRTLLDKVLKDQAIFGAQPEHDALLAGTSPGGTEAPTLGRKAAAPSRCDELAAHPNDPDRRAAGVEDEQLDGKAVVTACDDALRREKDAGRLHMQRARGLLAQQRFKDAVLALQQGVKLNNAVAHYYLALAYEEGAGGLPKDAGKATRLKAQADKLGMGDEPRYLAASTARRSNDSGVLRDARQLESRYEFGAIMQSVYWGDASSLSEGAMFRYAYLYGQAQVLGELCKSFKLTELDVYQDNMARMQMPADMASVFSVANLSNAFNKALQVMSNPRSAVDIGRAERRLADAPAYGARDLATFTGEYAKDCKDARLQRYTANLRFYLRNNTGS